jgi:hypothetical protein
MSDEYQFSVGDGDPDWSPGKKEFRDVYDNVFDRLRFHKGEGFTIKERPDGEEGPKRRLSEIDDKLFPQLKQSKYGTVFAVKAKSDGFTMLMRRKEVKETDKGQLVIAQAASREGTPYVFGATDCSWLTQQCVNAVTGLLLPHNAAMQRADGRVKRISRAQLKPGDLVFIDDLHHVALFLDDKYGGRVWDTEPHNTSVPGNWMSDNDGMLGVGVRIRPMFLPWYCGRIDSFGRIPEVNG